MFFRKVSVLWLLVMVATPLVAQQALPVQITVCMEQKIKAFVGTYGKGRSVGLQMFLTYTDHDLLGGRAYGPRNWKNFSDKEKVVALENYFNVLYQQRRSAIKKVQDPSQVVVTLHIADHPVTRKKGQLHIIAKAQTGNGHSTVVALLVTNQCKIFDFGQGMFVSHFVNASEVDAIMRRDRSHKE